MEKKPSGEVLRVAQELSFARALASNDKSLRDRALKRLNKWFASMPVKKQSKSTTTGFDDASFTRLWKGLYYCVWMSDKPLIQEECVERISQLVHSVRNFEDVRRFIRCFWQCMSQVWFNLDGHRLDKYLMLIRRVLRRILERLRQTEWDLKMIQPVLYDDFLLFSLNAPLGLNIHIAEIYLEELAKVGCGQISPKIVFECVKPFGELMSKTKDLRYLTTIRDQIFYHLLRQSEEAIKHQVKFEAWRQTGFAGGNVDVMEEVATGEDDDLITSGESDMENVEESPLDPRAGRVDVLLPPLDFDASQIIKFLMSFKSKSDIPTKARKQIHLVIEKFQVYKTGKYPLGIHTVDLPESEDDEELIESAAKKLSSVERRLIESSDLLGAKRKKKKKKLPVETSRLPSKRKSAFWETTPIKIAKPSTKNKSPATEGSWTVSPVVTENSKPIPVAHMNGFITEISSIKSAQSELSSTPTNSNPANGQTSITCGRYQFSKTKQSSATKRTKVTEVAESSWGDSSWETSTEDVVIPLTPMRSSSKPMSNPSPSSSTPQLNGHRKTGSAKKVEFVLNRNTTQEEREYKLNLKKRPSLPYDGQKRPAQGVLKQTPNNSPLLLYNNFPPSLAEIS